MRAGAVVGGGAHTCGVTTSGDALCWSNDEYGRSTPPAGESFPSVNAGDFHSCGVTTTGAALCYGDEIANPSHRIRGRNDKAGTLGASPSIG